MRKPTFNVSQDGRTVEVDRKIYNTFLTGPGNFFQLKEANYGQSSRQGTFGEQYILVIAAHLNQEKPGAEGIIDATREGRKWICADTAIYGCYGDDVLMFAIDFPKVKGGMIDIPDEKTLLSRLGKNQKGSVVFSDDGLVRAMPFIREGLYTSSQVSKSDYPTFLTGIKDAGELTAHALDKMRKPGYFVTPGPKQILISDFNDDPTRFLIGCGVGAESFPDAYSFGIKH